MSRKYFAVSTFALRSEGGGYWENDVIFSGKTYQEAFEKALTWVKSRDWSFETKIEICDKNGDHLN